MRMVALAFVGLSACSTHVITQPPVTSAAKAAETPEVELCRGPGDERARRTLEAATNASCVRFVPTFEAVVRDACGGPLAEALWRIDDRRGSDGIYSHATRARRNEALGMAALPLVKTECPHHFDADFSWVFPIASADEHWVDCATEPELATLGLERSRVGVAVSAAPAGAWLFADALARQVSPRGMRHVRRFLLCETIERVAGFAREVGKAEVVSWLSPYLVEPLVRN